jgi:hypothetical protein
MVWLGIASRALILKTALELLDCVDLCGQQGRWTRRRAHKIGKRAGENRAKPLCINQLRRRSVHRAQEARLLGIRREAQNVLAAAGVPRA